MIGPIRPIGIIPNPVYALFGSIGVRRGARLRFLPCIFPDGIPAARCRTELEIGSASWGCDSVLLSPAAYFRLRALLVAEANLGRHASSSIGMESKRRVHRLWPFRWPADPQTSHDKAPAPSILNTTTPGIDVWI